MTANEFTYQLSYVSAYVAAATAILLGYGFLRLSIRGEGLVRHLSIGLLLMHAVVFLRTFYWDVLRGFMGEAAWQKWLDFTNGTAVNTIFNAMVIAAGYHSLKALHLAIPASLRHQYSLIGAAFYPKIDLARAISNKFKSLMRRRGR